MWANQVRQSLECFITERFIDIRPRILKLLFQLEFYHGVPQYIESSDRARVSDGFTPCEAEIQSLMQKPLLDFGLVLADFWQALLGVALLGDKEVVHSIVLGLLHDHRIVQNFVDLPSELGGLVKVSFGFGHQGHTNGGRTGVYECAEEGDVFEYPGEVECGVHGDCDRMSKAWVLDRIERLSETVGCDNVESYRAEG